MPREAIEIRSANSYRWCGECQTETSHAVWTDGSSECNACGFFARVVQDGAAFARGFVHQDQTSTPTLPAEEFTRLRRVRHEAQRRAVREPIAWRARNRRSRGSLAASTFGLSVYAMVCAVGLLALASVFHWPW